MALTQTSEKQPIASIVVTQPKMLAHGSLFPVRAMLPLPEGRYETDPLSDCPFQIGNGNIPTWWRPVTFWPDGSARTALIGSQIAMGVPGAEHHLYVFEGEGLGFGNLPAVTPRVKSLMETWSALGLGLAGADGQTFFADLTARPSPDGFPESVEVDTMNELCAEVTAKSLLRPLTFKPGKAPHAGGVRADLTFHASLDLVELDIVWHNAVADEDNAPATTLGHVQFLELDLIVPHGWRVTSRMPMPNALIPEDLPVPGRTRIPLIPKIFDTQTGEQQCHVLIQQHAKSFRLVLHREGDEQLAEDLACYGGYGMPDYETGGYSSANPKTPGTWALGLAGPQTGHVRSAAKAYVDSEWAKFRSALESDGRIDHRQSGPLGPYRPWRGPYGGETGGSETEPLWGVTPLAALCATGIQVAAAKQSMILDRHGAFLVDLDGDPTTLDASGQYNFEVTPNGPGQQLGQSWLSGVDPLGFREPPHENRQPDTFPEAPYVAQLRNVGEVDLQHKRRVTGSLAEMRVLTGCRMSGWLEECVAAQIVVSWQNRGTREYGSTLGFLRQESLERPEIPLQYGRDAGHATYAVASAINNLRPGGPRTLRRARFMEWLDTMVATQLEAQGRHGFSYAISHGKVASDHGFRGDITQFYEHCILAAGMRAAQATLYGSGSPTDDERGPKLNAYLMRFALGLVKWWRPGDVSPYYNAATAPHENEDPGAVYIRPSDQPMPVLSEFADDFYTPVGLGIGLACEGLDSEAFGVLADAAAQYAGAAAPETTVAELSRAGLNNLRCRGVLLGVLQHGGVQR